MATSSAARLSGALLLLASACATTGARSPPKEEGSLALTDAQGNTISLASLWQDQRALVVVFWSAGCPCVQRYQARVDALAAGYPGARVVGVASNAGEAMADIVAAARARGVAVPIYRDEDGSVAAALGATSTPTVAILDDAGALRFLGWLDNERQPGEPGRRAYAEDALAALLSGAAPPLLRAPVYGCAITRSLFASKTTRCHGAPAVGESARAVTE
ncbi:MAG: redoxin family protein [Deltaproteobacteria bacterium]|nr:redoxin family protein [Deltaproteobacteria bacterium]